jgi:hypothetical protein
MSPGTVAVSRLVSKPSLCLSTFFLTVKKRAMKPARMILPSDTRLIYFGSRDVLENHDEKEERKSKINRAVQMSTEGPTEISIYLRLPNGETVETQSEVVNYYQDRDDIVVIKGGHSIPINAIVDVHA